MRIYIEAPASKIDIVGNQFGLGTWFSDDEQTVYGERYCETIPEAKEWLLGRLPFVTEGGFDLLAATDEVNTIGTLTIAGLTAVIET